MLTKSISLGSKILIIYCIFSALAIIPVTDAQANNSQRGNKWEASLKIVESNSTSIDGQNGSNIDLKSDFGWGLTLGYNLNPHILINFDFSSTTPSYNATSINDEGDTFNVNHRMDLLESQFNVVYNIFDNQFTPYIQAGAGWAYIDSNIPSSPPVIGCWYDPWWGYVCSDYQNTYNESQFSYNVAAGVKYELANSLFFRASYKQDWIVLSNSDDGSIGSLQLEIGSMF